METKQQLRDIIADKENHLKVAISDKEEAELSYIGVRGEVERLQEQVQYLRGALKHQQDLKVQLGLIKRHVELQLEMLEYAEKTE